MSGTLSIQPLTSAEVATVYEKCVEILSGHGVKVDHAGRARVAARRGRRT